MSNFQKAFAQLLEVEGGYSNHKQDTGGETMYGVTIAVARAHGYTGLMKDLPLKEAEAIYKISYWPSYLDQLPYNLAYQIFDSNVNSGIGQTARWLQRAIGVPVDGKIGPVSLRVIKAKHPLEVILLFNAERLAGIANFSTWVAFGRGWAKRIAANLKLGSAK